MTNTPSSSIDQHELVDLYSRTISYLRLSITDRCNLRCLYCMPDAEKTHKFHLKSATRLECSDLLSYEELIRIVEIAVAMGMDKLRLTGGEPLVRRGVIDFIDNLSAIDGLEDIRITTNGVLLAENAERLYRAGIRNINISLDTLNAERFEDITGYDKFDQVWAGIQAAKALGFNIKINVVAMRGMNDNEFVDFARLAVTEPFQIRFIEFMPVGVHSSWKEKHFISADDMAGLFTPDYTLVPVKKSAFEGPATMYRINDDAGNSGKLGFISPISHHFCKNCNRLRLTSEGKLRSCLLKDKERDLKTLIRGGGTDEEIKEIIKMTILDKPQGHKLQDKLGGGATENCSGQMSKIGG